MAGSAAAAGIEESLWLCPIEDRRGVDSSREGMIEGFSLGNYLLLVDYTFYLKFGFVSLLDDPPPSVLAHVRDSQAFLAPSIENRTSGSDVLI